MSNAIIVLALEQQLFYYDEQGEQPSDLDPNVVRKKIRDSNKIIYEIQSFITGV